MKLLEWWVSDPRPLKTANASAFISSFTNKVLASWFSHSVQWGGKGASLVAQMVKNLLQCKIPGFDPWVRKISRRRKWQPSLVFLPGESHGQRRLQATRQLNITKKITQNWVLRDTLDETGRHFENLLWKIENGLRNVNWFIRAKEVKPKKLYTTVRRKEKGGDFRL